MSARGPYEHFFLTTFLSEVGVEYDSRHSIYAECPTGDNGLESNIQISKNSY